ncbi:Dual-specificity RNA methyltransferase RlmN [subsurface metagenome]
MKIVKYLKSKDGATIKYLQKTLDNHIIETGYYNLDEHIVCVSSQIGCEMGCIFCATGDPIDNFEPNQKFIRNLATKEIAQQVCNIFKKLNPKSLESKSILFSFMGMGEPFLNYSNIIQGIEILALDFPNSRVTIGTLGISPEKMKKIANKKFPIILKIHLSLHAPTDNLRQKILPMAGKIKPALEALKYFSNKTETHSKVNYILIKNINDSENNAIELAKLLQPYPFIVKLSKLNPYNNLEPSKMEKFDLFEDILHSNGIETCRFISTGTDIKAGCGQLRRHYYSS